MYIFEIFQQTKVVQKHYAIRNVYFQKQYLILLFLEDIDTRLVDSVWSHEKKLAGNE